MSFTKKSINSIKWVFFAKTMILSFWVFSASAAPLQVLDGAAVSGASEPIPDLILDGGAIGTFYGSPSLTRTERIAIGNSTGGFARISAFMPYQFNGSFVDNGGSGNLIINSSRGDRTYGDVRLGGASSYTGSTTFNHSLTLDFTTAYSPTENVLYHGVAPGELITLPNDPKVANRARLILVGEGARQTFGGMTLGSRVNSVEFHSSGQYIDLGEIKRGENNFLYLPGVSNPTEGNAVRASNLNSNGILGTWAMAGGNWASNDGSGNIVPYSSYTLPSLTSAGAVLQSDVTSNALLNSDRESTVKLAESGFTDLYTLRLKGQALGELKIGEGNTLRLSSDGAIWADQQYGQPANWSVGGVGEQGSLTAQSDSLGRAKIALIGGMDVHAGIVNGPEGGEVRVAIFSNQLGLYGASTYSGGTLVQSGRVRAFDARSFGGGEVIVERDAVVSLESSNGAVLNDFVLANSTTLEGSYPTTRLFVKNAMGDANSKVTLDGYVVIASQTGEHATIHSRITGATGNLVINGDITLTNSANDFARGVNLQNGGILRVGGDGVIPHGVGVAGVNIVRNRYGELKGGRLDLNGWNTIINSLDGWNYGQDKTAGIVTNDASSGVATLRIGDANWSGEFGGTIQDGASAKLELIKIGKGTQILMGEMNHTGGTTIEEGTLFVRSGSVNGGGISVKGGGTFGYESTATLTSPVFLNGDGPQHRATLAASGIMAGSLELDNVGDTLAPGLDKIGVLEFSSSQSWQAFTYDWEFDGVTGGADNIQIDMGLTLTGGPNSYILKVTSLTGSDLSYLTIPSDLAGEIKRTWNIIVSGQDIQGGFENWVIDTSSLEGGSNLSGVFSMAASDQLNTLQLTYTAQQVPEPSGLILTLVGCTGLLLRRRSR